MRAAATWGSRSGGRAHARVRTTERGREPGARTSWGEWGPARARAGAELVAGAVGGVVGVPAADAAACERWPFGAEAEAAGGSCRCPTSWTPGRTAGLRHRG